MNLRGDLNSCCNLAMVSDLPCSLCSGTTRWPPCPAAGPHCAPPLLMLYFSTQEMLQMLQAREEGIYTRRGWFHFISAWGRGEKCIHMCAVSTYLPAAVTQGCCAPVACCLPAVGLLEVQDACPLPLSEPASLPAGL